MLRTGPGTDYTALGYLFGGEVIPYLGTSQKDRSGRVWYCCMLDGTTCWISSKYTKLVLLIYQLIQLIYQLFTLKNQKERM